jgi:hypothetical protein
MISIGTRKYSPTDENALEIRGLTREEAERVEGSIRGGHCWIRRDADGRLEHVPSYDPLPSPTEDDEMLPFWRKPEEGTPVQMEAFAHMPAGFHSSQSITIQHLCGYHYSPDSYRKIAERLESYGFVCLRSKREDDGKYWELWFLPGVWMAQGELKEAVESSRSKSQKKQAEEAIEFLRRNVQFGTLDASVQRLAMPYPE